MSQESVQTVEEEEIKSVEEQWRLSEMQALEFLPEASSDNNNSRNPVTELREHPPEMENNGAPPSPPEPKKAEICGVAFKELFRFAGGLDYALMAIGSVGAFVHGCSLPLFLRFFADLVNSFGSNANDVDKMMQEVLKVLTLKISSVSSISLKTLIQKLRSSFYSTLFTSSSLVLRSGLPPGQVKDLNFTFLDRNQDSILNPLF